MATEKKQNNNDNANEKPRFNASWLFPIIALTFLAASFFSGPDGEEVSYSQFIKQVKNNQVEEVSKQVRRINCLFSNLKTTAKLELSS